MALNKITEEIKLINGDAFKEIKMIANNSVHLICTDPQYFASRDKNGGGEQKRDNSIGCPFSVNLKEFWYQVARW